MSANSSSTLYIPIASPPTPAPSPSPTISGYPNFQQHFSHDPARLSRQEFASLAPLTPSIRRQYLSAILSDCTSSELLFISTTIAPLLKRDFLRELPTELALHVLSFIDDPKILTRASQVSKRWRLLLADEWLWKGMCERFQFDVDEADAATASRLRRKSGSGGTCHDEPADGIEQFPKQQMDPTWEHFFTTSKRQARKEVRPSILPVVSRLRRDALTSRQPEDYYDVVFSYRKHFKFSYTTMMNWRRGGRLLRTHRLPIASTDNGVITSAAIDSEWVVVGLANCKIYIFSAKTGVVVRTLVGHELGVWAVNLVSKGGFWGAPDKDGDEGSTSGHSGGSRTRRWRSADDDVGDLGASMARLTLHKDMDAQSLEHSVPPSLRYTLGLGRARVWRPEGPGDEDGVGKRSDPCCASEGWGQPNALVVSGGCDKVLRVWDVKTGYCIYVLHGHTSTIRCVKVLHNRPIAVSGSRDATLRVWDVQRGRQLRVLHGHQLSVRCLDVCGNQIVSGSYDTTCRLWDVDTGQCLHVLRGHMHQIYSVAFDGVRIASGGLDTTVRVWDAATGTCTALLQGHTALVCQLQLSPTLLATGGSDGRVITFCLRTFCALHRIAAHDSSVTSLQCGSRFLVTGGNDGRVRLFETATGNYVRELSEQSESVWKVAHRGDVCAIMCKRAGKTVVEIWYYGVGRE